MTRIAKIGKFGEFTEDIVRVLRVLEYVGPRSWVESTLMNNGVKGIQVLEYNEDHTPRVFIREAVVGGVVGYEVIGREEEPSLPVIVLTLTQEEWDALPRSVASYLWRHPDVEVLAKATDMKKEGK